MLGNAEVVQALVKLKSYLDYGMFQPIQIGNLTVPNRIKYAATEDNFNTHDGFVTDADVEYMALERYLEELAAALESGTRDAFRDRYGHLDMLLLDDVHVAEPAEAAIARVVDENVELAALPLGGLDEVRDLVRLCDVRRHGEAADLCRDRLGQAGLQGQDIGKPEAGKILLVATFPGQRCQKFRFVPPQAGGVVIVRQTDSQGSTPGTGAQHCYFWTRAQD